MEDQPHVNGAEPAESDVAEISPSQRAYEDAAAELQKACSLLVSTECPGLHPLLGRMLCLMTGSARLREMEIGALVELLVQQKIITKDQWFDKTAAITYNCARFITDAINSAKVNAPRLAIAQSLQGLPPKGRN